ncbi:MAG: rhodanese-like domain-containing protein [Desulfuromonadales bacterium]|nr:rhodanese-like domain-containing protein [Desulfuromonadales bacterium]
MTTCTRRLTATLILGLALTLAAGPALASGWGSKELETETIAIKLTREVQKGDYGIVRTDELKGWLDAGKEMLLVDTMPYAASYAKEHIPGAVQFEFPIEELASLDDTTREAFVKLLGDDQDRLLVFYCGFTKCGRSHNGAMWAKQLGYRNVYRHPGGIKAWSQADYPVAKVK